MEPHQRKNSPPRRESGSGQPEADPPAVPEGTPEVPPPVESDPAAYEPPAEPYVDPGEMHYDPGQANPGYVDPNQGFVDPNYQAYAEPPAEPYVDPSRQTYVDPASAAPEPAPDAGVYDEAPAPPPRKRQPLRKVAKKKVVRRAPAGRPVVARGRPGPSGGRPGAARGRPGAYQRPTPSYGGGGGISVMTVFLSLCAVVMLVIVAFVIVPRDMSSVSGYPAAPTVSGEPRNLLDEAQKIMISREGELALSEEAINTYLNERLQGKQSGMMAILVKFKGVYVDFTPGFAEVIVERDLLGIPITMSAKIKGEKFRRQILYKPAGWSIGRIAFRSRNIKPAIEMFTRLRESMFEEFQTMQMMADVRFEENRLVLDPSFGG